MRRLLPILIAAAALAPARALAQDPPIIPPFLREEGNDPRQEMTQLFHKVEKRLTEIDKLLYDAGAGVAPLSSEGESGILELLRTSKSHGQEVLSGIDRILEIARQSGGT